jgi:diguanylate cyclase (GGDEF)-like protein/PAS domain S-box-containing protein
LSLVDRSSLLALVVETTGAMVYRNGPASVLPDDALPERLKSAVLAAGESGAARVVTFSLPLAARSHQIANAPDGERLYEAHVVPLFNAGAHGMRQILVTAREITLEVNLCNMLTESRKRYKDLVECSVDFAWETDAGGILTFVSSIGALGFPAGWLEGLDSRSLLPDGEETNPFVSTDPLNEVKFRLKDHNGDLATVSICVVPIFNDEGDWIGARGVCRDITLICEHEDALKQARERAHLLNTLIKSIRDCVDPESMLHEAARQTANALNAPLCTVLRYTPSLSLNASYTHDDGSQDGVDFLTKYAERRVGRMMRDHPHDMALPIFETSGKGLNMAAVLTRHNHHVNGALCLARPAEAGPWTEQERSLLIGVTDYVAIAIAQFAAQEKLKMLARTDDLTGLMNRRGFIEQVEPRLAALARSHKKSALLYIDLDNFKQINDCYGHDRGDAVLRTLGIYLDGHTRGSDCCARLGGDEFAIWLDNATRDGAIKRAEELLGLADQLNAIAGRTDMPLSLSVGIVITDPDRQETLGALLDRADQAMYGVKRRGKSSYVVAQPAAMKRTG